MSQLEQWHLDKRVPITLIFAIFIQTASAFWWASQMESRVEVLERENLVVHELSERLVKVETILERIDKSISDAVGELRHHTRMDAR